MSSDEIMEGFVIALFTLTGLSTIVYCVRIRMRDHKKMKQSASMEDLNSIDTTDPEQGV